MYNEYAPKPIKSKYVGNYIVRDIYPKCYTVHY
jgi:hypothetical protein